MCYGDIMPWIRLPRVQVNSLTDSMSDWISKQIYSHHRVQHTLKYLHTPRSCQFYPYRRPLTHLHGYINTIVLMAMMQSWNIWVYKPQESSRMHKWNQTKRNKFMCVFYGLYCITGIISTAQIIEALEFCIRNGHVFFQIVPKIAGNITYCPECWSWTLTASEFAHHCACIWQNAVISTWLKCFSIYFLGIYVFI